MGVAIGAGESVAPARQLVDATICLVQDHVDPHRVAQVTAVRAGAADGVVTVGAGRHIPERCHAEGGGTAGSATGLVDQDHPRAGRGGRDSGPGTGGATAENQNFRFQISHKKKYSATIHPAATITRLLAPPLCPKQYSRDHENNRGPGKGSETPMPIRKNLSDNGRHGREHMAHDGFPARPGEIASARDEGGSDHDEGQNDGSRGHHATEPANDSHRTITGTPVALPTSSSNCAGSVVNSPRRMVLFAPW